MQSMKKITAKLDFIKILKFCSVKDIVKSHRLREVFAKDI